MSGVPSRSPHSCNCTVLLSLLGKLLFPSLASVHLILCLIISASMQIHSKELSTLPAYRLVLPRTDFPLSWHVRPVLTLHLSSLDFFPPETFCPPRLSFFFFCPDFSLSSTSGSSSSNWLSRAPFCPGKVNLTISSWCPHVCPVRFSIPVYRRPVGLSVNFPPPPPLSDLGRPIPMPLFSDRIKLAHRDSVAHCGSVVPRCIDLIPFWPNQVLSAPAEAPPASRPYPASGFSRLGQIVLYSFFSMMKFLHLVLTPLVTLVRRPNKEVTMHLEDLFTSF